jgi:hypothetical protein
MVRSGPGEHLTEDEVEKLIEAARKAAVGCNGAAPFRNVSATALQPSSYAIALRSPFDRPGSLGLRPRAIAAMAGAVLELSDGFFGNVH